jgi:hypothetical protein
MTDGKTLKALLDFYEHNVEKLWQWIDRNDFFAPGSRKAVVILIAGFQSAGFESAAAATGVRSGQSAAQRNRSREFHASWTVALGGD